jgi:hypothetical protein
MKARNGLFRCLIFYDKLSIHRRGVKKTNKLRKLQKKKTLIKNTELREKNQRN